MSASPGPTAQETVAELLRVSRRRSQSVPLRRSFLQQEVQHGILRAGPLATFLRTRDDLALNLFLLHRALVSAPPWDATRDARVWARALGLATPRDDGAEAVSKLWRRLDQKYHLKVVIGGGYAGW